MRHFVIKDPESGELQIVNVDATKRKKIKEIAGYPGWEIVEEKKELPTEFEEVQADGSYVEDTARKVDTRAGKKHIHESHLLKALEASLILSGVSLTKGLLAQEAAALHKPVEELAQEVYNNSRPMRTKELSRITKKKGAK